MKIHNYLIVIVVVFTSLNIQLSAEIENNFPVPSVWVNGEGSQLVFDEIDIQTKAIKGHYINNAEGYPCKDIPYPVTGWLYDSIITFSVMWRNKEESCNAVTAWTGYIKDNKISSSWKLINHSMTELDEIIEGTDFFELRSEK